MGLAPYGEPEYVDKILEHLLDLKDDGTFRLDMSYFNYCTGLTMTNDKFADLFDGPARKSETKITQREMDLAASIQVVTEEVVMRLARTLHTETGSENLCRSGKARTEISGSSRPPVMQAVRSAPQPSSGMSTRITSATPTART
jgi:carbamoyltransferase